MARQATRATNRLIDTITRKFEQLMGEINMQIELLTELVQEQLPVSKRTTYISLIINRVHHRDVIDSMRREGIEKSTDFLCKVQIKFILIEQVSTKRINFNKAVEEYMTQLELDRAIHANKSSAIASKSNQAAKENQEQTNKKIVTQEDQKLEHTLFPAQLKAQMLNCSLPYGFEFLPN